ncbi:hypothetical protein DL96DRAFT_1712903 [Flagelloscypha sp. PMI_526]|nr:hypothetical protein DL96DRAFT_1712903 [Flagelloscypha sp. PMI_526]
MSSSTTPIPEPDDGLPLSDLIYAGEQSRLRRRGAVHHSRERSVSQQQSQAEASTSSSSSVGPPLFTLFCGSQPEDSEVATLVQSEEPWRPSLIPRFDSTSSQTTTVATIERSSSGCGALLMLDAQMGAVWNVFVASGMESSLIAPLDQRYVDSSISFPQPLGRGRGCACERVVIACTQCGNLLGTRYSSCEKENATSQSSVPHMRRPQLDQPSYFHPSTSCLPHTQSTNGLYTYTFLPSQVTSSPECTFPERRVPMQHDRDRELLERARRVFRGGDSRRQREQQDHIVSSGSTTDVTPTPWLDRFIDITHDTRWRNVSPANPSRPVLRTSGSAIVAPRTTDAGTTAQLRQEPEDVEIPRLEDIRQPSAGDEEVARGRDPWVMVERWGSTAAVPPPIPGSSPGGWSSVTLRPQAPLTLQSSSLTTPQPNATPSLLPPGQVLWYNYNIPDPQTVAEPREDDDTTSLPPELVTISEPSLDDDPETDMDDPAPPPNVPLPDLVLSRTNSSTPNNILLPPVTFEMINSTSSSTPIIRPSMRRMEHDYDDHEHDRDLNSLVEAHLEMTRDLDVYLRRSESGSVGEQESNPGERRVEEERERCWWHGLDLDEDGDERIRPPRNLFNR